MLSSLGNPAVPPLMSPESATPSLFRQGMANMKESMGTPKGKVAGAMMQQQLSKIGQMFAPAQLGHQATALDPYGNPL